jgi:hypothetical protein
MKIRLLLSFIVLLLSSAAEAQIYTYSNLDQSVAVDNGGPSGIGWGSCVSCAGGDPNGTGTADSNPFVTTPSLNGASREFEISGSAYTNGLWWYKVGPNDAVSHFRMDFWLNVDSTSQYAQALEFDVFQFNQQNSAFLTGTEFMFGTECNYATGFWDVWDAANKNWVQTSVGCVQFTPNAWYHVTLTFHTSSRSRYQHYDSLTIAKYKSNGRIESNNRYKWGVTVASSPMPSDWDENMGLQFQMDIAGVGASMTEYVDNVTLKAW